MNTTPQASAEYNSNGIASNKPVSGTRKTIRIPRRIQEKFDRPLMTVIIRLIWQQSRIAFGSLLASFGFAVFQVPFQLAAGGVSGIGIIVNHISGFPVGMTILLLNIPLVALGFFQLGRWRFLVSTVLAVLTFSLGTDYFNACLPVIIQEWPVTHDLLLASIYAAITTGIGMGVIFRAGGTLGGTSIPARILHERFGFPMSQSYLYTDGAIILAAGLVFRWEVALLAILVLVLSGMVTDTILEGISQVRTASIVTQKPEEVRWAIIYQLQRGVSLWGIEGGYTGKQRSMVFCTVMRSRVEDLKQTIAAVDPEAFIVIGVAQQVINGYGRRRLAPAPASSANGQRKSAVAVESAMVVEGSEQTANA